MNYDNLFMFQSHPISLKQVFRTGAKLMDRLYQKPSLDEECDFTHDTHVSIIAQYRSFCQDSHVRK